MNYLQIVGFLCLWHLLLPFALRGVLLHWKMRWGFPLGAKSTYPLGVMVATKQSAHRLYFIFESLFASLLLSCGAMLVTAVMSVWLNLSPAFFEVSISDVDMQSPLKVGVFLLLVSTFGIPWLLFHYVGVPCVRDTHQLCKELRDALLQVSQKVQDLKAGERGKERPLGRKPRG